MNLIAVSTTLTPDEENDGPTFDNATIVAATLVQQPAFGGSSSAGSWTAQRVLAVEFPGASKNAVTGPVERWCRELDRV
jgi:hypothetical protein